MSGFVIKYIDIYNLLWEYKEKLETLIEQIRYCENSINDFIASTSFQGKAATAIKNYMNEVHITMLSSFKVTAQNILDNLILYKAGYYDIDSSTNFVLPEEEIKAFRTKLNRNAMDTEDFADRVNRKLGEVSDIYQVDRPDTNGVFEIHRQIDEELLNFLRDIETQERTTVTALEQSAELLISGLKTCVSKIGTNWKDITSYESNSFYQDSDVYALASLSQNCYQNHEAYKEIYDEIWTNEQALRDAADARETQGIWKTVGGVFLIVGGTICIVASGGSATPIVVAGWTAGSGTIAFGVADTIEGAQDIYYGSLGDIDTTSINYLKSVVFQGNEDAYYLTENVFAFASSAFIPISQAAKVGNLTFRLGATTVAKEGIAMMAGAGASDITMKISGNQTASVVAGMIAGGAAGHGLNGVDAKFNISGNRVKSNIDSYDEFSKAISDIGKKTDLTDAQKISELQKLFKNSNYKTDINVPSDIQYVKGFDVKGNVIYDWPPKLGFDENTIKSISRTNGLPNTWDRYGYMGGSNFADVPLTGKYTYSERAIPYVENEAAYHTGTFNNVTYFDKIDAIKNGDIDGLNTILSKEEIANVDVSYFKNLQNTYNDFIEDIVDVVGSNIDATYGLKGTAASWGDMSGGAGQYVTPLNGSTMKRLGIIK